MYVFCCSYLHNVAPKGKYIAFVLDEVDTDQPEVELQPGMRILGNDEFPESIVLVFSNLWKEKEAKAAPKKKRSWFVERFSN